MNDWLFHFVNCLSDVRHTYIYFVARRLLKTIKLVCDKWTLSTSVGLSKQILHLQFTILLLIFIFSNGFFNAAKINIQDCSAYSRPDWQFTLYEAQEMMSFVLVLWHCCKHLRFIFRLGLSVYFLLFFHFHVCCWSLKKVFILRFQAILILCSLLSATEPNE